MLRRRPGTSFDDFVDHHENRHAPLILSGKGRWIQDYRRSHVQSGSERTQMDGNLPDGDVITEATFARVEERRSDLLAAGAPVVARNE